MAKADVRDIRESKEQHDRSPATGPECLFYVPVTLRLPGADITSGISTYLDNAKSFMSELSAAAFALPEGRAGRHSFKVQLGRGWRGGPTGH